MKRAFYVTILSVGITILTVSSVLAQVDGFRGIKWGTEFSTVESEMRYVRTDPSYGGIKLYSKLGDELKIGAAELMSIQYGFWQNRFSNVVILFEGFTNFTAVRDSAFERFGRGQQSIRHIQRYFWTNNSAGTISVEYSEVSRRGHMRMASTQIRAEQERFDKDKAKS